MGEWGSPLPISLTPDFNWALSDAILVDTFLIRPMKLHVITGKAQNLPPLAATDMETVLRDSGERVGPTQWQYRAIKSHHC